MPLAPLRLAKVMQLCCAGVGRVYCLLGDSAYPMSAYLYRMYRGQLAPWHAFFNSVMSPFRVSVEWGFGKVANRQGENPHHLHYSKSLGARMSSYAMP
eukprot:scaffold238500_cov33-Tisochrysis_lutea.AAC.1